MKLSENEKALYAELAVRLAIRMIESSDYYLNHPPRPSPGADFEGCIIDSGDQSDLQECRLALFEMGILQAINPDLSPREQDPKFASFFRLKFGADGLREYVASQSPADAPTLATLIVRFIWLIVGYDYGIPARREAFTVPPDFTRLFALFERCGYVKRDGDKVAWTDKIAPEMRAARAWTEDLISEDEAEDAVADKMWRTMPRKLRDIVLSGGSADHLGLLIVISQFWEKGEWRDTALDAGKGEILLRDASMGLVRKLAKKMEESGA